MRYCLAHQELTPVWSDHGLSRCFAETLSSLLLFSIVFLLGGFELLHYRRYGNETDNRFLSKSRLYALQIALHFIAALQPVVRLLLQLYIIDISLNYSILLTAILGSLSWLVAVAIVHVERNYSLPSMPTWGHGIVLIGYWTLAFVYENIVFVNLHQKNWWFGLNSLNDRVEFICFISRYSLTLALFLLGLHAPGVPRYKPTVTQLEEGVLNGDAQPLLDGGGLPIDTGSPFGDFYRKLCTLLPFLWPKKDIRLQLYVFICFVFLIAGRIVNLFIPLFYKHIVNSLTAVKGDEPINVRYDLILAYGGLLFLQGGGVGSTGFLNNARNFLWIRVQQYTVREVQVKLYSHLHNLSLRWHLSRKTGAVLRVMSRGTDSINNLLNYMLFSIFPTICDILIAVIYFITAFNIWFGLITLFTMAFYLGVTIWMTEWRTKYKREMNQLNNAMEARGVDSLINFETVKYYGAEDYEVERYRESITDFQEAEWRSQASLNMLNLVQNTVIIGGLVAGTVYCAWMVVVQHQLTPGDYVMFATYIIQLYGPLNWFGTYYRMIQNSFIDMQNMLDLLKEEAEVVDEPNAPLLFITDGHIEFQDVCFHYVKEKQILNKISFTVPAGKTFALVGPSGAGKSTVIRLLFRLYDATSGRITIDGQDIKSVTQRSLRQAIGVVPQDTVLFNNDIRYNVRYGRVRADDDEVENAAKVADIHEKILTFPDGYDTQVGERGLKLSGGEKQRVAIARTVLKSPRIVLLDEATSALDTRTERNIQSSLNKMCANKTTIIIAHRLSTIIHADQILILKDGEIVERGRHDDLISNGGLYADMWSEQLRNEETVLPQDQAEQ